MLSTVEQEAGPIVVADSPPGVGPLECGDNVRCSIDRLGTMLLEVK